MEFTSFNSDSGRSEFGNNFDENINKINALKSLLLGHELGIKDINQLKEFKIIKEFLELPFNDKREATLKKLFAVAVNIAIKNKTFPIELEDNSPSAIASIIDESLNRVKVAYLSSIGQMDVIEAAEALIDRTAARVIAVLEKAIDKAAPLIIDKVCTAIEAAYPQTKPVMTIIRASEKVIVEKTKEIIKKGIDMIASSAKAIVKQNAPLLKKVSQKVKSLIAK